MPSHYYVALFDLADALKREVIAAAAAEPPMNELIKRLAATGIDAKQLPWLEKFIEESAVR